MSSSLVVPDPENPNIRLILPSSSFCQIHERCLETPLQLLIADDEDALVVAAGELYSFLAARIELVQTADDMSEVHDRMAKNAGDVDPGFATLVNDLKSRGILDKTLVIWMGEFGRSPRVVNTEKFGNDGRDHWPQVSCALLACGGMRTGQVIGATNRLGEYATERPVTFQEILATLYHNMGVNLRAVREFDLRGRPQYPVDDI